MHGGVNRSSTSEHRASRVGSTSGFLLFGAVGSAFGNRGAYVTCAVLAAAGLAVTLLLDRSGEGWAEPAAPSAL